MQAPFLIAFVLLTLAPRLVAGQASRCSDSTITGDRAGVIHIGMPLDSVRVRCPIVRDTTEMNEGEPGRVVYVLVTRDTLKVDILRGLVWFIRVRSPGFATKDSIRAGLPLARFLVGRHPRILVGEGTVFLLDPNHCGNSFGLSDEAYAHLPLRTEASLSRLPPSTMIDEILVTGTSRCVGRR